MITLSIDRQLVDEDYEDDNHYLDPEQVVETFATPAEAHQRVVEIAEEASYGEFHTEGNQILVHGQEEDEIRGHITYTDDAPPLKPGDEVENWTGTMHGTVVEFPMFDHVTLEWDDASGPQEDEVPLAELVPSAGETFELGSAADKAAFARGLSGSDFETAMRTPSTSTEHHADSCHCALCESSEAEEKAL